MKTKQITLEPYLTILHSWKALSNVLKNGNKSLKDILKEELRENYTGEVSYYFNFALEDSLSSFHDKDLIKEYLFYFKDSLDKLVSIVFNNSGKIKNVQLYKQITAYVFKEVILFSYMKKNRIGMQEISKEFFYEIPYYIDNLRDTHLHAGLAFNIFDIVEVAIRNFNEFEKLLVSSFKNKQSQTNKVNEIRNRFKLIINLSAFLSGYINCIDYTYTLDSLIGSAFRVNKQLPIRQIINNLKEFSLKDSLKKAISNIYDYNLNSKDDSGRIKTLASVIFIVNLNELLKVNTDRTLYKGLDYFSQEFIGNNPIKVAANRLVSKNSVFELYRRFFKEQKRVKAFELRMFPKEKSLKFWHNTIKLICSNQQRQKLYRFLSSINHSNCSIEDNSKKIFSNYEIDKEFSLIFHFRKAKNSYEFENINKLYKGIFKETKKFANFLRKNGKYTAFFSGIDAASMEYWTPAWVFAPLYSFWRNFAVYYIPSLSAKRFPLKFTFHAGEDFVDLGTGLKNIYEAIKFLNLSSGDRIGHGLALGIDVKSYCLKHRKVRMSPLYYFFHLLWLNYLTYKHEELVGYRKRILREISRIEGKYEFVREFLSSLLESNDRENSYRIPDDMQILLINIYESLKYDFINKGNDSLFERLWNMDKIKLCNKENFQCKIITLLPNLFRNYVTKSRSLKGVNLDPLLDEKSDVSFEEQILLLEKIRNIVLKTVLNRGIVIEACPSSNMYIRGLVDYKEHVVVKLKEEIINNGLRVTLNTDDPLVFNNNLLDEYLLIYEALPQEYKEKVVRALINNAQNFAFGG